LSKGARWWIDRAGGYLCASYRAVAAGGPLAASCSSVVAHQKAKFINQYGRVPIDDIGSSRHFEATQIARDRRRPEPTRSRSE
jgi:hypothetical protein